MTDVENSGVRVTRRCLKRIRRIPAESVGMQSGRLHKDGSARSKPCRGLALKCPSQLNRGDSMAPGRGVKPPEELCYGKK